MKERRSAEKTDKNERSADGRNRSSALRL